MDCPLVLSLWDADKRDQLLSWEGPSIPKQNQILLKIPRQCQVSANSSKLTAFSKYKMKKKIKLWISFNMEKLCPVFPVKLKKSHPSVKYSEKMTITRVYF